MRLRPSPKTFTPTFHFDLVRSKAIMATTVQPRRCFLHGRDPEAGQLVTNCKVLVDGLSHFFLSLVSFSLPLSVSPHFADLG